MVSLLIDVARWIGKSDNLGATWKIRSYRKPDLELDRVWDFVFRSTYHVGIPRRIAPRLAR